jgi:hypothetical protein
MNFNVLAANHSAQTSNCRGRFCFAATSALAAGLLFSAGAFAQIATGTTGIDASGNAQREMAACASGATQQARDTCMTEARNVNAEKRAGKLDNANGQSSSNAVQRCEVFKGEEKVACQARIAGVGSSQGSVAGGGVIREVETVVVPADATSVRIQPQTQSGTIVIVPEEKK